MLTAHKVKIFQSLDKKKFRQKYNLFLVEGNKTIKEIAGSRYRIREIYSQTPSFFEAYDVPVAAVSENELRKISFLQNPKDSVAICEIPASVELPHSGVQLVLDGVQDPGNLGTIIRLADWFGIPQIICSTDTADLYNPKVIQATMGSFLRVNILYKDLEEYLECNDTPAIGTDMEGENVFTYEFPEKCNLIFGNEGNGIRPATMSKLTDRITIPRFGTSGATESLNVAMSAGIILSRIFGQK